MSLQSEFIPINILDKCVYCIGGSIARNRGGVNKKLTNCSKNIQKLGENDQCRKNENKAYLK